MADLVVQPAADPQEKRRQESAGSDSARLPEPFRSSAPARNPEDGLRGSGPGTKNAKIRPSTIPPLVNSSGRMRFSRSLKISASQMALKTHILAAASVGRACLRSRRRQPGEELHQRIAPGNTGAAVPALAAQREVTRQRNIVVPRDRLAAADTMRARLHHAAIARPAVNAHVQKAADQQAEDEREDRFDQGSPGGGGRSVGSCQLRRVDPRQGRATIFCLQDSKAHASHAGDRLPWYGEPSGPR